MMVEGVQLLLVGMTTVFAFLGLLVGTMMASAAFFQANAAWFPDPEPPRARPPAPAADDAAEIAVILAAIAAHRAALGASPTTTTAKGS